MKSVELLVVLIGFVAFVVYTQAIDYCDKDLCGDLKHIACNNTGEFSTNCSSDRTLVDITPAFRKAIVKKHNELRNELASGNVTGFEPCPRMASIQWNYELQNMAEFNVKRCEFAHDECRNTINFPESGQNLAIQWSSVPFEEKDVDIVDRLIQSWWDEKKDTTMKEINSYPESFDKTIGHFTVMAVQKNNRMGCGIAKYRDPKKEDFYTLYIACNYAETNIIGAHIYSTGKTASECTTGTNPNYKYLCSQKEEFSH